jgi:hypothetical protein
MALCAIQSACFKSHIAFITELIFLVLSSTPSPITSSQNRVRTSETSAEELSSLVSTPTSSTTTISPSIGVPLALRLEGSHYQLHPRAVYWAQGMCHSLFEKPMAPQFNHRELATTTNLTTALLIKSIWCVAVCIAFTFTVVNGQVPLASLLCFTSCQYCSPKCGKPPALRRSQSCYRSSWNYEYASQRRCAGVAAS